MTKTVNTLKTESHKGRPIEFSIDENGLLGIEFDDYDCTYRYMSQAKARELRDWLNRAFPVEPSPPQPMQYRVDQPIRLPANFVFDESVLCAVCKGSVINGSYFVSRTVRRDGVERSEHVHVACQHVNRTAPHE